MILDLVQLPAGWEAGVDLLLLWAAETTLIAAGLAAVAALLAWPLAARPATRHLLWLMVLVKLVTPPLLAWPWSVPRPKLAAVVAPTLATAEPDPGPALRQPATVAPPTERTVGEPTGVPAAVAAWPEPAAPRIAPMADRATGPGWRGWVALIWVGGGLALAARDARRVVRFRRCLAGATPAPGWLLAEVAEVGGRLGIEAAPPVRVVRPLATPVLWCLGRPTLLIPERMLGSLPRAGWAAILAHELAHFRRGDPWVRWLELGAGLVWWWNPLYWLVRHRLDADSELACDAWAVWAAPKGRIAYAESLIRICTGMSPTGPPPPALGVAGTGRFFERRLTMILQSRSDHQLARPHRLLAALLAGLALPSWTWADPAPADSNPPATSTAAPAVQDEALPGRAAVDTTTTTVADDDDDDDDDRTQKDRKAEAEDARADQARADKDARADQARADERMKASQARADERMKTSQARADARRQAEMIQLQRRMEALGKEMETRFGPDSEFAKKFGPDSEFARNIAKEFGPDSEFAKKFGPDSEFARNIARSTAAGRDGSKPATVRPSKGTENTTARPRAARDVRGDVKSSSSRATPTRPQPRAGSRESRIDALDAQIKRMMVELDRLKAESKDDEDDGN